MPENLHLGEFRGRAAGLFSIDQSHFLIVEGFQYFLQPIRIDGVDMRTGKHNKICFGMGDTKIQGFPKSELTRFNMNDRCSK